MNHAHLVLRPAWQRSVGSGHLARALSLAQAWSDRRGRTTVVAGAAQETWVERFAHEGVAVVAAESDVDGAGDVVVTDGYDLPAPLHEYPVTAVVDDFGLARHRYPVDVLVDQNGGDPPGLYARAARTLSGPRYALLRREFVDEPPTGGGRAVLVSLGGQPDPDVVRWAQAVTDHLGGEECLWLSGIANVTPVLARGAVALAAAGSTTWELCRYGVVGAYVALTPNQERVLERIEALGIGTVLGRIGQVEPADAATALSRLQRRSGEMASRGRALVDGHGAGRVVTALRAGLLTMRPVTPGDRERLFRWRNDPATRQSAKNTAPIGWEEHVGWFDRRYGAGAGRGPGYVALLGHEPIGQFRVDLMGDGEGLVDVTVAPGWRGAGWAGPLIDAGATATLAAWPQVHRLVAEIRRDNVPSQRAFHAADFDPVDASDVADAGGYTTYARRREVARREPRRT